LKYLIEPLFVTPLLLIVSFADSILGRIARKYYDAYTSNHYHYESAISKSGKTNIRESISAAVSKIIVIIFLLVVLQGGLRYDMPELIAAYKFGLGFTLAIYLISDLRHIESIFIGRLLKGHGGIIEGKVSIKPFFSLRQTAIQLFTIFILLGGVALITCDIFFAGVALAPLAIIIRNLALIRS
jgi:hypothetical protein